MTHHLPRLGARGAEAHAVRDVVQPALEQLQEASHQKRVLIVLITSEPAWRFTTTRPLSKEDQAALASPQQLDLRRAIPAFPRTPGFGSIAAAHASSKPGWNVHVLRDARKELRGARWSGAAIGGFGGALLTLAIIAAQVARAREKSLAARREAARQELETQVNLRTRELKETNERLVQEVDERTRAEATLHTLQDELVQANKLAVLGQISAGVAHEINQPVAAIRSYVDNARAFLERAQPSRAAANLTAIASLTERIGDITQELLTFSRKSSGTPQQVEGMILWAHEGPVAAAVDQVKGEIGDEAAGGGGPRIDAGGAVGRRSDGVRNGARGGAAVGRSPIMPAWGEHLTDEQIKDVVAYLRKINRRP